MAINQADVAMKGRYWNSELNKPEPQLVRFLEDKVDSVKRRIKEGTGVDTDPIYYCAGFKEEGQDQCRPYNLSKLLYYIIKYTPMEKRLSYIDNINQDKEMWKDNDDLKDYSAGIAEGFGETIVKCASAGVAVGQKIGAIFGGPGKLVGGFIGGVVGGIGGFLKSLFW